MRSTSKRFGFIDILASILVTVHHEPSGSAANTAEDFSKVEEKAVRAGGSMKELAPIFRKMKSTMPIEVEGRSEPGTEIADFNEEKQTRPDGVGRRQSDGHPRAAAKVKRTGREDDADAALQEEEKARKRAHLRRLNARRLIEELKAYRFQPTKSDVNANLDRNRLEEMPGAKVNGGGQESILRPGAYIKKARASTRFTAEQIAFCEKMFDWHLNNGGAVVTAAEAHRRMKDEFCENRKDHRFSRFLVMTVAQIRAKFSYLSSMRKKLEMSTNEAAGKVED